MISTSEFASRYLWSDHDSGGVVIDLASGNYFEVNTSVLLVCKAIASHADLAVDHVATTLRTTRLRAEQLIQAVLTGLDHPAQRRTPNGAYHFVPKSDGYALTHGGRSVLTVLDDNSTIQLPPENDPPPVDQLELYMRALAPKVLFRRGLIVLHASAVEVTHRIIAFSGLSGAGKTTTARAFRESGARLVSEDLLVLDPHAPEHALAGAEPFIQEWARQASLQILAEGEAAAIDLPLTAMERTRLPIDRILFLERSRRSGETFETRPLPATTGLVELMNHLFLGAKEGIEWRRFLLTAQRIVESVELVETTAPASLSALSQAAPAYLRQHRQIRTR